MRKVMAAVAVLVLASGLSGCGVMERRVKDIDVRAQNKEPVRSIALMVLLPEVGSAREDRTLRDAYVLAGALDARVLRRFESYVAEFLELNGVHATPAGVFARRDLALVPLLRSRGAAGESVLLLEPEGMREFQRAGVATSANVRYRFTLLNSHSAPMMVFHDYAWPASPKSGPLDLEAAGWLNALIDNGFVEKRAGGIQRPASRDLAKEDRDAGSAVTQ